MIHAPYQQIQQSTSGWSYRQNHICVHSSKLCVLRVSIYTSLSQNSFFLLYNKGGQPIFQGPTAFAIKSHSLG